MRFRFPQLTCLFGAVFTVVMGGCVVNRTYDFRERLAADAIQLEHVPVRSADSVAVYEDTSSTMGIVERFSTGKLFAEAFNGDGAAAGEMQILSSQLRFDIQNLGVSAKASYSASILVTLGDQKYVLNSTHSSVAGPLSGGTGNVVDCVEKVINDLVRQAKLLIPQNSLN